MKKNNSLFAIVKKYREKLNRFSRFVVNGDTEQISHFDRTSPEIVARSQSFYVFRCFPHLLQVSLRAFKQVYVKVLRESRVLRPDNELCDGKYAIASVYKNAWCSVNSLRGETVLRFHDDTEGILFSLGKQAAGARDGELIIELANDQIRERVLAKKLSALEPEWQLYHAKIPATFKTGKSKTLKFCWAINEKAQNVCLSQPVLKSFQQKRTCIVLVLDGVRFDFIDACGMAKNHATPNIDQFFAQGMAFKKSYAQSNWTLPVFASIALSQYASEHHVVDPDVYPRAMKRDLTTLAEIFQRSGFYTYGSVSHRRCNQALGHHRGYEHFHYEQTFESKQNKQMLPGANNVYKQVGDLCDTLRNFNGVDFFGFVHLFDTHYPFLKARNQLNECHLVDQALVTLAEVDRQLAQLFSLLKDRENVTVILTSDHGYSFSEVKHTLSDQEIRTPFLIFSNEFSFKGAPEARYVESSVDILPTLVSLYGFEDSSPRSGLSLFDSSGQLIEKDFALSEIVYLDRYKAKIVHNSGSYAVFSTNRNRRTNEINYKDLSLIDYHLLEKSTSTVFGDYIERCKVNAFLKSSALRSLEMIN